jgi:hypothetical protein
LVRSPPTPSSSSPSAATSTSLSPCTTTRGPDPIKVLGLELDVNITLGLPVIRTSVDHCTAFDIAGTGKADDRSLVEAKLRKSGLACSSTIFALAARTRAMPLGRDFGSSKRWRSPTLSCGSVIRVAVCGTSVVTIIGTVIHK